MESLIQNQLVIDRVALQKHIISLAELEQIIGDEERCVFPVNGDCLAGAGIEHGDYVAVSFRRFPRPPKFKSKHGIDQIDSCLCYAKFPGEQRPAVMIKQYRGVWGSSQMVGTRYKQEEGKPYRMNAGFFTDLIFGVVFACWDHSGHLKWSHNLNEYPEALGQQSTIHGENCGDPQQVRYATMKAGGQA